MPVTSDDDKQCFVCCRDIELYAVGPCDHPVCHRCSTRMRVLCQKNECPVCRSDMEKVYFVHQVRPYEEINASGFHHFDARSNIAFEDTAAQEAFRHLLEYRCIFCDDAKDDEDQPQRRPRNVASSSTTVRYGKNAKGAVFSTLSLLRSHLKREHRREFCDLCLEHLRLFPVERSVYNRKELERHMEKGDANDTSHRGHPKCEFCTTAFVDVDELYRHMRKQHYHCHFCDETSSRLFYYRDYELLREHFRTEHFLCMEGDCRNEQFTSAFRTEIDLKAHKAQHHSASRSKAEARQLRTIEAAFDIAPRTSNYDGGSGGAGSRSGRDSRRGGRRGGGGEGQSSSSGGNSASVPPAGPVLNPTYETNNSYLADTWRQKPVDISSNQEFPTLAGTSNGTGLVLNGTFQSGRAYGGKIDIKSKEQFPTLGGLGGSGTGLEPAGSFKHNVSAFSAAGLYKQVTTSNSAKNNNKASKEKTKPSPSFDFPPLGPPPADPSSSSADKPWQKVVSNTAKKKQAEAVKQQQAAQSASTKRGSNMTVVGKTKENKPNRSSKTSNDSAALNLKDIASLPVRDVVAPLGTQPNSSTSSTLQTKAESTHGSVTTDSALSNNNGVSNNSGGPSVTDNFLRLLAQARMDSVARTAPPPPGFEGSSGFAKSAPPGFTRPPPGLTAQSFNSFSNGNPMDNLSSLLSGSSSNAVSKQERDSKQRLMYTMPYEASMRNQRLIENIQTIMGEGPNFNKFKTYSGEYRRGQMDAPLYFEKCASLFNRPNDFLTILPELVFLLPDIDRQRALLETYNTARTTGQYRGAPMFKFKECPRCRQIVSPSDMPYHEAAHLTS